MASQTGAAARLRRLVLLRHAKADQPIGIADSDRPLTERGHADAAIAGAWLVRHGYLPDLVLCSPARRTRQTWHSVAVALAGAASPNVRYERPIYDGAPSDLLKVVQSAEPDFGTVLVIGHNPAISLLSQLLDDSSELDSDGLRTCGIAVHEFTGDWARLDSATMVTQHTARLDS